MARSSVDDEFESRTLAFVKKYAISPQDFKGAPPAVFDRSTKNTQDDDLLTVDKRENQIAFTKLQEIPFATGTRKNAYNMFFHTKAQVGAGQADYVPVWFLPWASNRLVSMTIPPKLPPRQGRPVLANDPHDPDIFVTAAINGCSVIVHGNPKTPTISHGGTEDPRSTKWSLDNHFEFGNARTHWTDLHKKYHGSHKDYRTVAGIHTGDYRNTAGLDNTPEALEYQKFLKDTSGKTLRIDDVVAQGAVFGLRSADGNWSFYLQKNVEITVTRMKKKTGFLKKTTYVEAQKSLGFKTRNLHGETFQEEQFAVDAVCISIPTNIVRFFPGGMRADKAHAMIEPNQVKMIVENAMR